jgi:hypothetical protein
LGFSQHQTNHDPAADYFEKVTPVRLEFVPGLFKKLVPLRLEGRGRETRAGCRRRGLKTCAESASHSNVAV